MRVSVPEMLKGFSPVVVQLVAVALRIERFSWLTLVATSAIAAGTVTTAATGVASVSTFGLLVHLASHACEALRVCMAQLLMCSMRLHQMETLRLMSSACMLFFAAAAAVLEWPQFAANHGWEKVLHHPLWYFSAGAPPPRQLPAASSAPLKHCALCLRAICAVLLYSSALR
jgi:hypothetical protein